MGKIELSKVYFGARMVGYTGRSHLDHVGQSGVLVVYDYVGAEGECLPIFYFDEGRAIGWVRHSHSRYTVEGGLLSATSIRSGTVKEYDVSGAVERGPEVFEASEALIADVPDEWREIYVNVYPNHCWHGEPTRETGRP